MSVYKKATCTKSGSPVKGLRIGPKKDKLFGKIILGIGFSISSQWCAETGVELNPLKGYEGRMDLEMPE